MKNDITITGRGTGMSKHGSVVSKAAESIAVAPDLNIRAKPKSGRCCTRVTPSWAWTG